MSLNERDVVKLASEFVEKWADQHLLATLARLVRKYLEQNVILFYQSDIVDQGDVGDEGDVEITIENKGPIPMRGVRVSIEAANHAIIGTSAASMGSTLAPPVIESIAAGARHSICFQLRLVDSTYNDGTDNPEPRSTLRVRITEWTPALDMLATAGPECRLLPLEV